MAKPATPRQQAELRLREAWHLVDRVEAGFDLYRVIRAAVRAVVPGRQQRKNLDPLIDQGVRAAVRVLRRDAHA